MPLSEADRERIDTFLTYIEDANGADERYGRTNRCEREGGAVIATRFETGLSCWLEVAVHAQVPLIRVAFVTDDRRKDVQIEQAVGESDETITELLQIGFEEAGLFWPRPPIEHYRSDDEGHFYFATPLELEDLADVDDEAVRNKILRMLEGHLITFGPAIMFDEVLEDEDE